MGRADAPTVSVSLPVSVVVVGGVTEVFAPDIIAAVIVVCPGEMAAAKP
jgi:hypothetical protein